ncbi:MAG TPA: hypothetical protein VN285_09990 [Candidatus Deferrimicrobium sp.]|nr:hypothetical protein [Candidatus Deferrimicrobium sp.]
MMLTNTKCTNANQVQDQPGRGIPDEGFTEIAATMAAINNGINNALSVIVGNIQCLLLEGISSDQKSLSRLRRIEGAALQISTLNRKVLELYARFQTARPPDAARPAGAPETT